MNKYWFNKIAVTTALLIGSYPISFAAKVPAGVVLADKQEMVRGGGAEVASLDPHKVEGVPESDAIRELLEGLVEQNEKGNIVPGVAESWSTNDNLVWVFKLRNDAKWSNGDPVTAKDFEYSFKRAADPKTASPYSWFMELTTMKNAKDIVAGKKPASELGVKAIDDHTLQVTLEQPLPYFIQMTAHTTMKPVHQATIDKYGDKWTRPENFVGNGAYKLSEWVVNEKMVMVRNPYYWDNKSTVINKLTVLPIEDNVSEMNRFLAGEIDLTYNIPKAHLKDLKKDHAKEFVTTPQLCVYFYEFNTKKPPFDDIRVRKAISYGMDRDIATKNVLAAGETPAYYFTPPATSEFKPITTELSKLSKAERLSEAKKLLKEAGYDKQNPLTFSLLYNTDDNHKRLAVAMSSVLKKELGVNVKLENQEWKTFLQTRREGGHQASRAGWCADFNEPSTFLYLWQSTNSNNTAFYSNPEFDKIMKETQTTTSESERVALYQKAEELLARDVPFAPIYHYVRTVLLNPKVGGFPYDNPQNYIYTKDLYMIK